MRILIVGAGVFGSVCARELTDKGHTVRVLEKREGEIGGNCFTRYHAASNAHQHVYGPHIFHTNSSKIWEYVHRFAEFNSFINRPKVNWKGEIYSFPINLMTLQQVFKQTFSPTQAEIFFKSWVKDPNPSDLESWCISEIGRDLYEIFVRGYTKKQWGVDPRLLPPSIIKRLPVRTSFDDNYFTDQYQGVPKDGYTALFRNLLAGIDIEYREFSFEEAVEWDRVIYTGSLDTLLNCRYGKLPYRSLRFETWEAPVADAQGNAVINFTEESVPYTRIVEHKHFTPEKKKTGHTLLTKEFPERVGDPYYPIETEDNRRLHSQYASILPSNVIPGGRLAEYRYYDMHQVFGAALTLVNSF